MPQRERQDLYKPFFTGSVARLESFPPKWDTFLFDLAGKMVLDLGSW